MAGKNSKYKIPENSLITVNGKSGPVLLMGLVNSVQIGDEMEGWTLVISGNCIIPHNIDKPFKNKILMKTLNLTKSQEESLQKTPDHLDGFVYLYAGNFIVGKCRNHGYKNPICQQQNGNLSLLKILKSHVRTHIVQMNGYCVVTLSHEMLQTIIKAPPITQMENEEDILHHQIFIKREKSEKKENLRFRVEDRKVYVELECPANHSEYHVGILILETFVFKPNMKDAYGRRSVTQIFKQADIHVPAAMMWKTDGGSLPAVCREENYDKLLSDENVIIPVKGFKIPAYQRNMDRHHHDFVEECKILHVEYRGIAHLIKDNDWRDIKMEKLLVNEVAPPAVRTEELPMKLDRSDVVASTSAGGKGSTSGGKGREGSSSGVGSTLRDDEWFRKCAIPVKFVVLEIELEDLGEDGESLEQRMKRSATM